MSGRLLVLGTAVLPLMAAPCAETTPHPRNLGVPEFVRVTDPFAPPLGPSGSRRATGAPPAESTLPYSAVLGSAAASGLVTAGRMS